jgi:hypothetical protein
MDIGKYFAWALFLALVGAVGSFTDRGDVEQAPTLKAPSSPRGAQMVAGPKMQPVSVEAASTKVGTSGIR